MRLPTAKQCLLAIMSLVVTFILTPMALAQPASRPADANDKPPLTQAELEQLLAPIALYPDSLLTQMLMASTYPLEVVQADRWVKANKDLKGDALGKELEKQSWDASVKSMVNFPDQLAAMSDKLELTLKLGNAFLEQQTDVLNTIQVLRSRAQAAGNLKSNDNQTVNVQAANATTVNVDADNSNDSQLSPVIVQQPPQIITIESPKPDIIYVPSYSPAYVYGAWPYPAYPPYYYYPGYYYGANLVSFGFGVALGAAWGYAWGGCNWGHGDVDIDIDRNINRNTNINRDRVEHNMQNRQNNRQGNRETRQGNRQSWQHDPSHRGGVSYRDQRTSDRFGGANSSRQAAQARSDFRGRASAGQQPFGPSGGSQFGNRGGAGSNFGQNRPTPANRPSAGNTMQNRAGSSGFNRTPSTANRGTSGGAFNGVNRGSSGASVERSRGQASRGSRPTPSRSGGFSGGSRGGGGARGGGGRGGGRR
jgi:hypothetical protein